VERQYVAVDLHLHRPLIVRENEAGEKAGVTRIDNDLLALADALREQASTPRMPLLGAPERSPRTSVATVGREIRSLDRGATLALHARRVVSDRRLETIHANSRR
jgi:hypothetical protein